MESFTTDDSFNSNHSESILRQDLPENNMTDINMSIINSEADTCRNIFSTPMVTLPPQNSFPYISTPTLNVSYSSVVRDSKLESNAHLIIKICCNHYYGKVF